MRRRYFRQNTGRFRAATLRDFGMGTCRYCGCFFAVQPPAVSGAFVDPRDINRAYTVCADCGGDDADDAAEQVRFVPVAS